MNEIPTAEEFLQGSITISHFYNDRYEQMMCFSDDVQKAMIEFAKLHVKECKKEYLQKGFGRYMNHAFDKNPTRVPIDEDSILNAYPLENIK